MKKKLIIFGIPILLILTVIIMDNTRSTIWYQESTTIDCTLEDVNRSLNDLGEHYTKLINGYPGMTTVELIDQGRDHVTIKTNEGTMKRTNISVNSTEGKIVVEFDEEYLTSMVTSNSHFTETFQEKDGNTELNIQISNMVAPGFLGFFLRNFGSKNIGSGFLNSYKNMLEE